MAATIAKPSVPPVDLSAQHGRLNIRLPYVAAWADPVWHLYAVQVEDRDVVRVRLKEMGIATAVHYPTPIHPQPAYAHRGHAPGSSPEARRNAARVLILALFSELPHTGADRVVGPLRPATTEGG